MFKMDAKTIAALAALFATISGGVEMRVQIGLLTSKVDRIEERVQRIEREVSPRAVALQE